MVKERKKERLTTSMRQLSTHSHFHKPSQLSSITSLGKNQNPILEL